MNVGAEAPTPKAKTKGQVKRTGLKTRRYNGVRQKCCCELPEKAASSRRTPNCCDPPLQLEKSKESGVDVATSGAFEEAGCALAAAYAHGDYAVTRFAAGHFVGQGADHAGASHAEGVADGDAAAVDI
jgi:hypothetical protein